MSKFLKFGIIVLAGLCLALLALILIGVPLDSSLAENVETEVASESAPSSNEDLIQALQDALELATGKWTVFDYIIDHIQVEDDGQVALVWLAAVEIESGEPLGREPELALAELQADGTWVIHLEDSEPFDDKFRNFQYAEKRMVGDLIDESQAQPKSSRVFGTIGNTCRIRALCGSRLARHVGISRQPISLAASIPSITASPCLNRR